MNVAFIVRCSNKLNKIKKCNSILFDTYDVEKIFVFQEEEKESKIRKLLQS